VCVCVYVCMYVYGVGLQPLDCWDCGFESRRAMDFSLVSAVLSGRGPCVGQIARPMEAYRVWCVWVWSWCLYNEETLAH